MPSANIRSIIIILLSFLIGTVSSSTFASYYSTKHTSNSESILEIKKINVDYLGSSQGGFGGYEARGLAGLSTPSHLGEWARIEVEYQSFPDWTDEVDLDIYVLMDDEVILKGTLKQINLSRKHSHKAVFYLHPTTLERFRSIHKIAIQGSSAGKIEDTRQWPSTTHQEWWKTASIRKGLLKKSFETPFFLNDAEKYEDTEI